MQKRTITHSWGVGLSHEQSAFLRKTLGDDHELFLLPPGTMRTLDVKKEAPPFILWMDSACGNELEQLPDTLVHGIAATPKVLLLNNGYSLKDIESACDNGFSDILRPPLSRERIVDIMRRALEAHALHHDMECMTREIMLERELLERKNEILSFLVGFLANASESLDLNYLLQTAYISLERLLPVRGMHAVLWEQNTEGAPLISLHIGAPETSKAHGMWREVLLEHARNAIGPAFAVTEINRLHLHGQTDAAAESPPDGGSQLLLPLISGNERLGLLLLVTAMERHLGRDQALALDSAMRHFSLSIKNARRFRQMQMFADYDALTRVHSRRHFEAKLDEEMERLSRYGEPLSMIMLDIDHFKLVNDTRGHHVGDIVLREVASIIAESIRTTDYCARYGGEEFVVLLPHTGCQKAFSLSERIRSQVATHTFLADGGAPLNITISLGLSSLTGESLKNKQALICEADAALYAAKENGRNMVCVAPQVDNVRYFSHIEKMT